MQGRIKAKKNGGHRRSWRTRCGLQGTRVLGRGPGTQWRHLGPLREPPWSLDHPPRLGATGGGARGAGRGADAQSCWKTRVRLPGEGGARQALYPSENPRARRGGRNHPKWRGQAGPCHPSKVAAPTPPRRRCPWTPALFPREVNLNWSYRGSWLEN